MTKLVKSEKCRGHQVRNDHDMVFCTQPELLHMR